MKNQDLTEKIIGAAYNVYNTLGHGLLERGCESALAPELRRAGVEVEQQRPVPVRYQGGLVGDYVAGHVVDGKLIVGPEAVARGLRGSVVPRVAPTEAGLPPHFTSEIGMVWPDLRALVRVERLPPAP